jgi:hypothetical protein
MKLYVVLGINNLTNSAGPLGVARTPGGRDKILRDTAYCSDVQQVFEVEVEEDRELVGATHTIRG